MTYDGASMDETIVAWGDDSPPFPGRLVIVNALLRQSFPVRRECRCG